MNLNHFFSLDSPLMTILTRIGNLIILNLLFIVCSIPVVTIGAAWTALHYVCLRMLREEEGYVARDFFRSFRTNFRQSTLIWLIMMVVFLIVGIDMKLLSRTGVAYPVFIHYILIADAAAVLAIGLYAFPLQARFENPLRNTIRNAAILMIGALPRTLCMLVLTAIPVVILLGIPKLLPIVVIMGFSSSVYACAALYDPVFRRLEPAPEVEEEILSEPEEDTPAEQNESMKGDQPDETGR